MIASNLRVNDSQKPLGIDPVCPSFSWIPFSEERESAQTSYQILVAESEGNLTAGQSVIWNSGLVNSPDTLFVPYGGGMLKPAREYWWKVRLRDQKGADGEWSQPSMFGTGLSDENDWSARWIGSGPQQEPLLDFNALGDRDGAARAEKIHGKIPVDESSTLLRKEVDINKPIQRAVIFVCGLGFYVLNINGQRVGNNKHTPSKTDYREHVLYDAYDVTEALEQGANAIGIMLGNGWYNPSKRYWDWHMQWHGSKRARLQLHIQYQDGTEAEVYTDGSWKTSIGPVQKHCLYDGELYDARKEQAGWDHPGFSDTSWTTANEVQAPGGRLFYQNIEPIRIIETIRPKSMWEASPGIYVFDMGQNFSGVVRLKVKGPRGTEICIRHAENLYEDGRLDIRTNNNATNMDRYILKGEGEEIYEPYFVYHGFRYVEIRAYPGNPTLDCIDGRVLHTDCLQTGEFRCSNDLINHIHHCTVWSQRSNMMGLPTDNNQRDERLGWMADGHLAAEQFIHNFEPMRFYRKWLRDIKYSQDKEGNIPFIVPRPFFESGTPAWSSAYPLVTWYLYKYSGDKQILKEHFESNAAYVDYLTSVSDNYILPIDRYGDHLSIAAGFRRGSPELCSTFYYYYDTVLLSEMAEILGLEDKQQQYSQLAEHIQDAFNLKFFDKKNNSYGSGSQCEQILPLSCKIESEGLRNAILENLIADITVKNQGHLRVGIIGAKVALDLLMMENRHDVIWDWATQTEYPSLGYMVNGYTTLSETWQKTGTNNHVMWGNIDTWFYQGLAGIQAAPKTAGYQKILIKPYMPDDLQWVKAAIHTLRGRIASGWHRKHDCLQLNISIPANTTAEIHLPMNMLKKNSISEGDSVIWNGAFLPGSNGILDAKQLDDLIVISVGSGEYTFCCN